ncbi:outer membrane protein assembly factor BamE [Alteraurantiacibacter aestuarii]|uniref:Outer membrane protein assembly factor BamE n=1 Tax=Alteraurantiacibacter aestuarii TaxID=650004 RepID=A0A844ZI07_9SPHN|nr:outer membrane protein assembly factor BamE [Alteraurantiacibacter aestuarii]MXO87445.1 outer membrane protein assembly factor BamE [Alteraurantiacibacter aestuarii]
MHFKTGHSSLRVAAAIGAFALVAGCSSIQNTRGYLVDEVLVAAVQPGLDNQESVRGTLGRPTLTSQFGDPVWYYISSRTNQRPFTTPRIATHSVLAVRFDEAGNVISADRTGMDKVVLLDPDSGKTPTLGRHRSLLEDLFGNIGTVGAPGVGGGGGGPG